MPLAIPLLTTRILILLSDLILLQSVAISFQYIWDYIRETVLTRHNVTNIISQYRHKMAVGVAKLRALLTVSAMLSSMFLQRESK